MAKRICFISKLNEEPLYEEMEVEFKYFNGFAVSQKQKSIAELALMHEVVYNTSKSELKNQTLNLNSLIERLNINLAGMSENTGYAIYFVDDVGHYHQFSKNGFPNVRRSTQTVRQQ